MKKISIILIALLLALSCTFGVLYAIEKNDQSELEQLCHNAAYESLKSFEQFRESGEDFDYISAVAEFNAYLKSYYILTENKSGDYAALNSVYGYMILNPDKTKTCVDDIIGALEYLSEDYDDMNGINLMYNVRNQLKYND